MNERLMAAAARSHRYGFFAPIGRLLGAIPVGIGALVLAGCEAERYPQTTLDPATDFARDIASLQAMIFWWIMGVLVVVTTVLLYVLIRFRARPGAPEPRRIHGNNTLEILWTLGPAVIVAMILVPTVQTIFASYQTAPDGAIRVEAIGHQWWWEFRYPDLGVVTANQIHVPAGTPVHLELSSADVLHNFWAPRLGGKRYSYPDLPGPASERENFNVLTFTIDEPGSYSGQCAEFCGTSHAHMRFQVVAMDDGAFGEWVSDMGAAAAAPAPAAQDSAAAAPPAQDPNAALIEQGRQIFAARTCVVCHTIEGVSQGVLGPSLTRFGERWSLGAGAADNTQENLEAWIREPGAIKAEAKMPGAQVEGGGMGPTGLSDEEITAVAAYLLSLR